MDSVSEVAPSVPLTGVGVLDKAMTVLHAVAAGPCGLADLQATTGIPRATAHRLSPTIPVAIANLRATGPTAVWVAGGETRSGRAGATLCHASGSVQCRGRPTQHPTLHAASARRRGTTRVCMVVDRPTANTGGMAAGAGLGGVL